MSKEIKAVVRLQIPAGEATPAPPVGSMLAPHGINMQGFCQAFNERTKDKKGWTIPVEITVFEDRSFEFVVKQPPTAQFIKRAANIEKASGKPLERKVGSISREQLREIAEKKIADLNTDNIEKAMDIVEGTAKAMGVTVER